MEVLLQQRPREYSISDIRSETEIWGGVCHRLNHATVTEEDGIATKARMSRTERAAWFVIRYMYRFEPSGRYLYQRTS